MRVSSKGSGNIAILPMFSGIVYLSHVNLNPVHARDKLWTHPKQPFSATGLSPAGDSRPALVGPGFGVWGFGRWLDATRGVAEVELLFTARVTAV